MAANGGIALIPVRPAPHTVPGEDAEFAEVAARLSLLRDRMDARTTCAVDLVEVSEIRAVVPQLRDLLTIARRKTPHRPVVRFGDLALEFQLSRPSRASRLSAARLAPVVADDVLWETLRTHLQHDCTTSTTAAVLHVHPNTVQYRLRKVTDLTGLNLNRPGDLLTALGAVFAVGHPDSITGE